MYKPSSVNNHTRRSSVWIGLDYNIGITLAGVCGHERHSNPNHSSPWPREANQTRLIDGHPINAFHPRASSKKAPHPFLILKTTKGFPYQSSFWDSAPHRRTRYSDIINKCNKYNKYSMYKCDTEKLTLYPRHASSRNPWFILLNSGHEGRDFYVRRVFGAVPL